MSKTNPTIGQVLDELIVGWLKEANCPYEAMMPRGPAASTEYRIRLRAYGHRVIWATIRQFYKPGHILIAIKGEDVVDLGHINDPAVKANFMKMLAEY